MKTQATQTTTDTIEQIEGLQWVAYVEPTDRPDVSHCVHTHRTVVRFVEEIRQMENLGVEPISVANDVHKRQKIYVVASRGEATTETTSA